jgi:tetratricopeptide (TPR) repeat protein
MAASLRLSLCMIVRDSARTLPACLASISPWVDEIIVVDTGSMDDTRDIARQYGARVFDFAWCDDFSAARNESLRHATGEWLFWMDSDDTITAENGRKLRALADVEIAENPTAFVMQVHCPGPPGSTDCTVVDHVKMFRNDNRLRFEGRIHEQILPAIRRIGGIVDWTDIYVTHSGSEHSAEAKRRKQQRDLRLLDLELVDHPNHPFVLFNLGMTYADMEDADRAVEYLKRCLFASAPEESHVRKAYALLVGCLTQVNRHSEARQILERGRELYPDDAELQFRQGILEHRAGNHEQAIAAYCGALEDRGERCFSSRDYGITGHKARHNLAGIYREMGQLDMAERQWRLAIASAPAYLDGWRGLVDTLLKQKKIVALEIAIESAQVDGLLRLDEIICARARLMAAKGDADAAIQLLDDALSETNPSTEVLCCKCQLAFDHSTPNIAIAALEELCRHTPNDCAAWHNLGTAYHRAGYHAQAELSYQKSLVQRPNYRPTLNQLADVYRTLGRGDAARPVSGALDDVAPDNRSTLEPVAGIVSSNRQKCLT